MNGGGGMYMKQTANSAANYRGAENRNHNEVIRIVESREPNSD